ncbi:MAG: universal stress protein [Myxococcota bacterium]|nr:universal stress protein [Myxococcota bacterium]
MKHPLQIRCILVPVDYSEASGRALDYAQFLAEPLGAQVDVVHVWDRPSFVPNDVNIESGGKRRSLGELVRENSENEMLQFLEKHKSASGELPAHRLLSGEPAAALVAELERGAHDLVVLGTRGHTGLKHLLLGSVAEKLVRFSSVPVVTVR